MSKHSLTKKVGHGSNKQNFVANYILALCFSSSETVLKKSNLVRSELSGSVKESVMESESLVLTGNKKSQSGYKTFLRLMRREYTFRSEM